MWQLSSPLSEILFRAFFIYVGLFILFRMAGKKQLGKMSPFDFVLLLIVSESVSNALGSEENSVLGGLISAATLIGLSVTNDFLAFKSKRFAHFTEGEPQVLVSNGKINEKVRRKEQITRQEIEEALRSQQIFSIEEARYAILETNGEITAVKKSEK